MPYKDPEKQKAFQRAWNKANPQRERRNKAQRAFLFRNPGIATTRYRTRMAWLNSFKTTCGRCGYAACTRALHFHHKNGADKDGVLSEMVHKGVARAKILAEIAKCVLLCANCHSEEHCKDEHRSTTTLARTTGFSR